MAYDVQKTLRDTGYITALAIFLQKTGSVSTVDDAVSMAKQIITGERPLPPGAPPFPISTNTILLVLLAVGVVGVTIYLMQKGGKKGGN